MVQIHCAYTAPLNPPGASPVLSREQVWQGLQRKIRRAQDFVPVITSTDVLEERDGGNEVVRVAHFRAGGPHGAAAKDVREVCKSFWPVKVRTSGFFFLEFHTCSWGESIFYLTCVSNLD